MASFSSIFDRPSLKSATVRASTGTLIYLRRWRALGGEACWVFVGLAAGGVGSIVGVRILTGLLPPAVFGEYALSLTVVAILQYCYAGTSAAAMRFFVPAVEKRQAEEYLRAAWRVQHTRGLLAAPLVLGGVVFLMLVGQTWLIPLGLAATVLAVVTSYNVFMDGLQNAGRQRAVVALHQGLGSWVRLGCAALLVILIGASAANVLWGFVLGAIVTMGSQYVFYRRVRRKVCQTTTGRCSVEACQPWHARITRFAWPYVVWSIPVWLQLCSDRWALGWLASPAEVGIYAALCQLALLPVNVLTQLVTQLVEPILFARAGDLTDPARVASSRSMHRKVVGLVLSWTIVAVVAAAILRAPVGRLLLDARYQGAVHFLPLLVLAAGLFATGQLAELNIITSNKTALLIRPKSTVAILACAAYPLGASLGGIGGVVCASVVTKVAFLLWILWIDRRVSLAAVGHIA